MSKINEFKEKAMAALGTIINKSTDLYESAEEKAKYLAKTTKLKAEIAKESADVKKLYADLGSLYYCLYSENPDEKLSQLCDEIKTILDRIDIKQRELEALAAENPDNEVVVDLTEDETSAPADECVEQSKTTEETDSEPTEEAAE